MAAPTALLFDLDGTLWDSWPWYAQLIGRDDQDRRERVLRALRQGEPIANLLREAGIRESKFRGVCNRSGPCELYDGVAEGLPRFSDLQIPLGIVTNLPGWIALPMLRALELEDYFDAVIYYARGRAKPSAAPMHAALGELGIQPSEAVWYVGDTENDQRASGAAGLSFAWAAYGYGKAKSYDRRLERFEQILEP